MDSAGWFALAREYRRLRESAAPNVALRVLQTRLEFATGLLVELGRPNAATDLEVMLGYVRVHTDLAEGRRVQQGRSAEFWRTGRLSNPLRYTVQASYGDGHSTDLIECTSPGCAIKHALALFCDEAVRCVFISANRAGIGYTIGRDATMATLAELSWPVE